MILVRTFSAELRKAATLPGVWAGAAVILVGSVALTLLNSSATRAAIDAGEPQLRADTSPFETAFAAMPLGTVGAVVIGVVVIGSEYTAAAAEVGGGRQVTTTLIAVPHRARLLLAKAAVVVLAVVLVAAVALPLSIGLATTIIGEGGVETVPIDDAVRRCAGGALYWVLTALIAFAITALARSGVVPLLVLIVNSSLVSFSLLLTNLTPLAHWLPDMAGRRLFDGPYTVDGGLDAIPGAIVMATWALALVAMAAIVFRRRDA